MADRTDFRSLPSTPFESPPRRSYSSHSDRLSPAHPAVGTVPLVLSPLDAFAFHGRMLAKKFEEETRNGKRLSRLPPLTIQKEFGKPRPGFLSSLSSERQMSRDSSPVKDDYDERDDNEGTTPRSAKEVKPAQRHMSTHPVLGGETTPGVGRSSPFPSALACVEEDEQEVGIYAAQFPFPRSRSPDVSGPGRAGAVMKLSPETAHTAHHSPTPSLTLPIQPRATPSVTAPSPSLGSMGAPPSIRSVLGSDDDDCLSLSNSVDLYSMPKALVSPFTRSPSMVSERSFNSVTGPQRPTHNFSRPLSRARGPSVDYSSPFRQDSGKTSSTRPSLEVPFRQDFGDSPSTPSTNDAPHTPVSICSDEFFTLSAHAPDATATYIYAKYSIPKEQKRESIGAVEFFNRHINWDETSANATAEPILQLSSTISPLPLPSHALADLPPKTQNQRKNRPADIAIPRKFSEETQSSPRRRLQKSRPSSPSTMTSDASTIKARLERSKQPSIDLTAKQHLAKGIECHEAGSLQESTYHFRLAAKAGLPDAMLLYALACRHGWGMRINPAEAVSWLQKAVDSSQLEVAEDEATVKQGKTLDAVDIAKHRAQFALAVYELGMSHNKGWGVPQDKSLALRCFEVAGNWGDTDALAEAAFCYSEGIGCKKDMKKAARFYRMAEAKGLSMAGNSWIHKEKYKESDDRKEADRLSRSSRKDTGDSSGSKKRDKSRTRAFFARKKSSAS